MRRSVTWMLLALAGCTEPSVDLPPRDGGATTAPRDAGSSDAGVDTCGDDVCDPGESWITCRTDCPEPSCPDGEEGCDCRSSFSPGDVAFAIDDCEPDLRCIPWDVLSGRDDAPSLQTCVKPCEDDAECGTTDAGDLRRCVAMDYPGASAPIGKMCVDRIAPIDGFCSGSNDAEVTVPNGELVLYEIVGCPEDNTCLFAAAPRLEADEGVCVRTCGPDAPPCPPEYPYCNPNALDVAGEVTGVCSSRRNGVGARCGSERSDRGGLTELCDTSSVTPSSVECVPSTVFPLGVCIERCDEGPCQTVDPTQGALTCVEDVLPEFGDACAHPNCGTFVDTCEGPGSAGHGRICQPLNLDAGLCVDRGPPLLEPTELDRAGTISRLGDDCITAPLGELSCPEPTGCFALDARTSRCVVACDRAASAAVCADALTALGLSATNAACVEWPTLNDVSLGFCAADP